ncbi:hypothetical protein [Lysinibacillus sp. NPDC086135]|uniref:hypothetical protein n=1 Tax=Lysinibacillus sp. NPDC086135 TaxID=3364130 RepID=UPI003826F03C
MNETVRLKREHYGDFIVNYHNGLKNLRYVWRGAEKGKVMSQEVPYELYDWLLYNTTTIRDGELQIAETEPNLEEIKNQIPEVEEYEANSHSKEEVIKLLKGNINKMKSELNKVVSQSEKRFIKAVADELNENEDDGLTKGKNDFINEWVRLKSDEE